MPIPAVTRHIRRKLYRIRPFFILNSNRRAEEASATRLAVYFTCPQKVNRHNSTLSKYLHGYNDNTALQYEDSVTIQSLYKFSLCCKSRTAARYFYTQALPYGLFIHSYVLRGPLTRNQRRNYNEFNHLSRRPGRRCYGRPVLRRHPLGSGETS